MHANAFDDLASTSISVPRPVASIPKQKKMHGREGRKERGRKVKDLPPLYCEMLLRMAVNYYPIGFCLKLERGQRAVDPYNVLSWVGISALNVS